MSPLSLALPQLEQVSYRGIACEAAALIHLAIFDGRFASDTYSARSSSPRHGSKPRTSSAGLNQLD